MNAGLHWQATNSQKESPAIFRVMKGRSTSLALQLRQLPFAIGRPRQQSESGCQGPVLPSKVNVQENLRGRLYRGQIAFSVGPCPFFPTLPFFPKP